MAEAGGTPERSQALYELDTTVSVDIPAGAAPVRSVNTPSSECGCQATIRGYRPAGEDPRH